MRTRIIANYLPQYHVIPENSRWWGDGYTDWTAVRSAKPLFEGHKQPHVPVDGIYRSLDNVDSISWQAELAKKYGIDAFGIYHYWFSSEQHLLQKPAEILLSHPDINIGFMFLWDNCSWKRTWGNVKRGNDWAPNFDSNSLDRGHSPEDDGLLAELIYGGEKEWKEHFDYLLPFFQDPRYVRIDERPIFGFMQPNNDFEAIRHMAAYWELLAQKAHLRGLHLMTNDTFSTRLNKHFLSKRFRYSPYVQQGPRPWVMNKLQRAWHKNKGTPTLKAYDNVWKQLLRASKNASPECLLSGFVSYDDTPRRGKNAWIVRGATPSKFQQYFTELLQLSIAQGKEIVFLSAWNEWGEGMHLEPDDEWGVGWLQAVYDAKHATDGGEACSE